MKKYFPFLIMLLLIGCSSKQTTSRNRYIEESKNFLQHIDLKNGYLVDSKPFNFKNFECRDNLLSDTINFTKSEIQEINNQIEKPKIKKWSNSILKNAKIIDSDEIDRIFRDKNRGWKYFHEKYGNNFNTYSAPIFLRDYSYCLFYFGNHCGGLCGGGALVLYKKENGEWKSVDQFCMWIS